MKNWKIPIHGGSMACFYQLKVLIQTEIQREKHVT